MLSLKRLKMLTVTPAVTTPPEKVDVPDARDAVTMDVEKLLLKQRSYRKNRTCKG